MTEEHRSIEQVRRAKADAWQARGFAAFGNDTGPLTPIGTIVTRHAAHDLATLDRDHAATIYRVAGRVIALRDTGKLVFVKLRDGSGEVQLFLSARELGEAFALLKELDLGDFVQVSGRPMRTRHGELSILAREVRPLTKSYRPLPPEFYGLNETESRYRQRYVDLVANWPEVPEVFRARSRILQALRAWFDARDFVEVETPTLQPVRGGATAKPFVTHHHALDLSLYLRIAPELYLKRLLVGGLDRVYEIGRVWRNEGISTRHNPEFTLLEFYQAYATYTDLMEETEDLVAQVDARLLEAYPRFAKDRDYSLDRPWRRVRMLDAVRASLQRRHPDLAACWDLLGGAGDWAAMQGAVLAAPVVPEGRDYLRRCRTAGELLFALFELFAEPHLVEDYRTEDGARSVPVFIVDHPFDVSPLARQMDAARQRECYGEGFPVTLVDRFELFIQGRELANAFSELNDPDDQAARFRAQLEQRDRGDEEAMDFDADYIRALEYGMPPAAGFGLGVDRLVMLLAGVSSIRDVLLFPLLRPEG